MPSQAGSGARLAEFSIRYPITICMIFVSLLTLGLISSVKIPLVLLPDVDFPALNVSVPYPNATPAQIQESITKPLEEALSTIQGGGNPSAGNRVVARLAVVDPAQRVVRGQRTELSE